MKILNQTLTAAVLGAAAMMISTGALADVKIGTVRLDDVVQQSPQFKAGAEYRVTPEWKVGADLIAVGSQYYVGDDANQNQKLPGYAIVNLHTSYDVTKNVTLFAVVNNLFNNKYALYGTYFEPEGTEKAGLPITLTDTRTQVPGMPFAIYGGVKVRL